MIVVFAQCSNLGTEAIVDKGKSGSRQRKPYTGFGKMLRRLMWERDVRSWLQLEEMIMRKEGERYSHQSMSRYAAGASAIPPEFVRAFSKTLNLSEAERAELSDRYTYHSLPDENQEHSA